MDQINDSFENNNFTLDVAIVLSIIWYYWHENTFDIKELQCLFFFKLLFAFLTANFGPLSRRQPH